MDLREGLSRRRAVKMAATGLGASALAGPELFGFAQATTGRIKQAAARWCYKDITIDNLAGTAAGMGLAGLDLVDPPDWPALKRNGLVCTMAWGGGTIPEGFNRKENHDKLEKEYAEKIPAAAAAGCPNIIALSGNRRGLSDQEGIENCVAGLNRIKGLAEQNKITVCLELLNSKVDHKDYQCDHTAWGVEVVKKVDSPRVKLLYDIYHMQIMEGDIIRTIRQNAEWIGHFHTGGVPGRHELDDKQELNWAAIMRAIADSGYTGVVAHEFVPTKDPVTSLKEAVKLCSV